MRGIDRLEHHAELLRIRRRAARREGVILVILLTVLLLAAAVLSSQTGYEPDAVGLFTTALVSLMITILASMRMAEYRMLKEALELVDVLHDVMEQEQQ
jgi:hypothetical protein